MTQLGTSAAFEDLAQRLVQEYWSFYPTAGSRIGLHGYDGKLPDLSPGSLRRRVEQLQRGLAQLSAINLETMDQEGRLSHRLLELFLKRENFALTEWRPLETNPMRQVGYLNVSGYLLRDYAPLDQRLRSVIQVLQQVPDFLNTLDAALGEDIGRPVLDMSIESYSGMARFYRVDLAQGVGGFSEGVLLTEFSRGPGGGSHRRGPVCGRAGSPCPPGIAQFRHRLPALLIDAGYR